MFDLSLGEILLVIVVAVVFIGPKELPVVVRAIAKGMRAVRGLVKEVQSAFDGLAEESGIKELKKDIKLIQGDDGQMYESFTMPEVSGDKGEGNGR